MEALYYRCYQARGMETFQIGIEIPQELKEEQYHNSEEQKEGFLRFQVDLLVHQRIEQGAGDDTGQVEENNVQQVEEQIPVKQPLKQPLKQSMTQEEQKYHFAQPS